MEVDVVTITVEEVDVAEVADVADVEVDAIVVVPEPADPPCPANGPAMLVVSEPDSTKMPDQYQSSGSASVPPFGRRSSPMCQSAEFVDVDALTGATTCTRSFPPVDCQSATVLALKSMSYAKLYQVSGTSCVLHCVFELTSHRRRLSVVPDSPEIRPYLISVKWLYE